MFGLVDTSETPALGHMEVVSRRDAAILLPIIRDHTAPGTIIHSDESAAYRSLPNVAGHGVVNHSLHFVEPTTGVHTQHIKSYWSQVKTKLKRMRGCHAHQLPSYLDEYMWRERYGETARDALHNIMHHSHSNTLCNTHTQKHCCIFVIFVCTTYLYITIIIG